MILGNGHKTCLLGITQTSRIWRSKSVLPGSLIKLSILMSLIPYSVTIFCRVENTCLILVDYKFACPLSPSDFGELVFELEYSLLRWRFRTLPDSASAARKCVIIYTIHHSPSSSDSSIILRVQPHTLRPSPKPTS